MGRAEVPLGGSQRRPPPGRSVPAPSPRLPPCVAPPVAPPCEAAPCWTVKRRGHGPRVGGRRQRGRGTEAEARGEAPRAAPASRKECAPRPQPGFKEVTTAAPPCRTPPCRSHLPPLFLNWGQWEGHRGARGIPLQAFACPLQRGRERGAPLSTLRRVSRLRGSHRSPAPASGAPGPCPSSVVRAQPARSPAFDPAADPAAAGLPRPRPRGAPAWVSARGTDSSYQSLCGLKGKLSPGERPQLAQGLAAGDWRRRDKGSWTACPGLQGLHRTPPRLTELGAPGFPSLV